MPLINTVECDQCKTRLELGEGDTPGAELLLMITDANHVKTWFCKIECLRAWAAKYESPYKRPEPGKLIPLDAILPMGEAN